MKAYNPKTLQEVEFTPQDESDLLTELFKTHSKRLIKDLAPKIDLKWRDYTARLNGDFLWRTHRGDYVAVSGMDTNHLFYAFRMLFNHGVPPAFRVGGFIRRNDVFGWSREYKEQAFEALRNELIKREDELGQDQKNELKDMEWNSKALARLESYTGVGLFSGVHDLDE